MTRTSSLVRTWTLALLGLAATNATAAAPPTSLTPEQTATVLDAAKSYRKDPYRVVKLYPDRSPLDCMAPPSRQGPVLSAARTGDAGHGTKLYYLFAKDDAAYRQGTGLYIDYSKLFPNNETEPPPKPLVDGQQAVGQVIVKEAWTDKLVEEGAKAPPPPYDLPAKAMSTAWIDGATHHIGERSALFIMAKVGPAGTPQTDAGWVYATVTPDGREVTSGGLLPSCMGCHKEAKADRLFGPKVSR